MIISVWRYSHLTLAISSFLLLTLAAVTGIILAFEPISEKSQGYAVSDYDTLNLAEVVPVIRAKYKDVQKLSVDDNRFVILEWTSEAGLKQRSYVDPRTGKILGSLENQKPFFKWVTALHRSMFLHETGRFIVGLSAFLLILICISGIILVVQRQKGLRRFFAGIERINWAQYYHVVFGRIVLFPILFIAFTGTYLTISRFEWINASLPKLQANTDSLSEEPALQPASFPVFREANLASLKSIEFPFSDFPEDYYTVKFDNRVAMVNQFTGDIITSRNISKAARFSSFALRWHTGRSNILWAIISAISCCYILFFIYSGFVIMFRRKANVLKNKFRPDESSIIILVGSENGTTMRFARSVYLQLISHGKKVYLTDMDNFRSFAVMQELIVMTSTYGLGDPPSNARHFTTRLTRSQPSNSFSFSVLAFGSRTYADYCKFGLEVDLVLSHCSLALRRTEVYTINDRSPEDFAAWCKQWSEATGIVVDVTPDLYTTSHYKSLKSLAVTHKTILSEQEDTFLVRFAASGKLKARSGDLLAVYPANDYRERLYSIAMINNELQLSVKHYRDGLGSEYLDSLSAGSVVQARIIKNEHFHFPAKAPAVIMISNGTGIAPFLGMIGENKTKVPVHLYCGFRFKRSFALYEQFLRDHQAAGQLASLHVAFSREEGKEYVMNQLTKTAAEVTAILASGGVLMICGSLAMQKDVLQELSLICKTYNGPDVEALHLNGKILTDCY